MSQLSDKLLGGTPSTVDVFVSYSYRDDPALPIALYLLLQDENCRAYIPKRFSRESGRVPSMKDVEQTKNILAVSKSLILVDGPQTTRSQWIPWEIGYVAGSTGKVAVFSAARNENEIKRREFLNLYPNIAKDKGKLILTDKQMNSIGLNDWLKPS